MPERPILTAEWRHLLLLNFAVPADVLCRLAPPGTEPDLLNGQAYVSIVGFRFERVRLFGLPLPGYMRFPEINLRYYVRRLVDGVPRRGVVFVREIAPRWAVVATANWLYNENYVTRRMRSQITMQGAALAPGDSVEYAWRSKQIPLPFREGPGEGSFPFVQHMFHRKRWNRLAARVAAPLDVPGPGSPEEYFVENYWGYVKARDGTTREYQVAHEPWHVARADDITFECNVDDFAPPRPRGGEHLNDDAPSLAEFLTAPPACAFIAVGSPIKLYRGRRF